MRCVVRLTATCEAECYVILDADDLGTAEKEAIERARAGGVAWDLFRTDDESIEADAEEVTYGQDQNEDRGGG
jgi:hypothetical protein